LIIEALDGLAANGDADNMKVEEAVRTRAQELTRRFPIYS
jgi:glycine hydroxymethyltransferase